MTAGPGKKIQLCGMLGESLKHAVIRIEYNVEMPKNRKDYVPNEANRKILVAPKGGRRYIFLECTELSGVPDGSHVIGVSGNVSYPEKVSSVAQVVVW